MKSSDLSPRDEVIILLRRLLSRASEGIESGEFALTKPKEVLDAAKLLLDLLGQKPPLDRKSRAVGKRLVERLERLEE